MGLHDEFDLSLRALEILKNSDEVFLESYTNFLNVSPEKLKKITGKKAIILNRSDVEEHPEKNVLKNSKTKNVSLLVSGDPMVATTHLDLVLRAKKSGIPVKIIHSSSISSAIAETGLQLYKFGRTTSLVFPERSYFPKTPYDVLKENKKSGLHTLLLLDVKSDQKKFMSVSEAIEVLLKIEEEKKEKIFTKKTRCVGVARLGSDGQIIKYGSAEELQKTNFGKPPHVLVVPGKMHFMEEEALERYL